MIKVLSILQPHASLCVLGHKKIETRSFNTKYRGELYIHASMHKPNINRHDDEFVHFYKELFWGNKMPKFIDLPLGAIIGKVDLVDTFPTKLLVSEGNPIETFIEGLDITPQEIAFGDYSPNRFGWILENPVMFDKPIPTKGKLGIWNFEL